MRLDADMSALWPTELTITQIISGEKSVLSSLYLLFLLIILLISFSRSLNILSVTFVPPPFFSSSHPLRLALLACSFIVYFHFFYFFFIFISTDIFSPATSDANGTDSVILAAALICLLPETKPDQSRLINESLFTLSLHRDHCCYRSFQKGHSFFSL